MSSLVQLTIKEVHLCKYTLCMGGDILEVMLLERLKMESHSINKSCLNIPFFS